MKLRGWSTAGWMLTALVCVLALVGGEYAWRTMIHPTKPTTEVKRYEWQPVPGEPAKDFGLPGDDKKIHRLSDLKGKEFVLTFYCGCGECRSFTKELVRCYKESGRQVPTFSVFVPGWSPGGTKAWIEQTGAHFTYVYSKDHPEILEEWHGTPCPKAYVIGKDQKIRYASETPMVEHNDAMVADIAKMLALKYTPTPKKPATTKKQG